MSDNGLKLALIELEIPVKMWIWLPQLWKFKISYQCELDRAGVSDYNLLEINEENSTDFKSKKQL